MHDSLPSHSLARIFRPPGPTRKPLDITLPFGAMFFLIVSTSCAQNLVFFGTEFVLAIPEKQITGGSP